MKRFAEIWQLVRRLSGDDAYERYLEHHRTAHAGAAHAGAAHAGAAQAGVAPLDERAFWLERQRRKWSGVQRCC